MEDKIFGGLIFAAGICFVGVIACYFFRFEGAAQPVSYLLNQKPHKIEIDRIVSGSTFNSMKKWVESSADVVPGSAWHYCNKVSRKGSTDYYLYMYLLLSGSNGNVIYRELVSESECTKGFHKIPPDETPAKIDFSGMLRKKVLAKVPPEYSSQVKVTCPPQTSPLFKLGLG